MESVGWETSWNRREEVEEVDEECVVRFQGNRDEMEGGCEGLGEYPSDRIPSIPWDPDRHSLDHTSEMSEVQEGAESEGSGAQRVYSRSTGRGTTCLEPTDERSWETVEVDCSHEQNEGQGYDRDKEGSGLEEQRSDEGEEQDSPANAYRGVHDPSPDLHVGCLDR